MTCRLPHETPKPVKFVDIPGGAGIIFYTTTTNLKHKSNTTVFYANFFRVTEIKQKWISQQ